MENTTNNILAETTTMENDAVQATTTTATTTTATTATTTTANTATDTNTTANTATDTTITATATNTKKPNTDDLDEEHPDDFLDYKFSQYLENGSSYDDDPRFDRDYGDDYDYDCDRDDAGYDSY